ncbi:MAG: hypothetical protein ACRDU8_08560, partial [Egibacteraceae bacterium]
AQQTVGRLGGGYVSPETAACAAAVGELAAAAEIGACEHVVVFDTGVGHKYPPPPGLPQPPVVTADETDVERLLAAVRR